MIQQPSKERVRDWLLRRRREAAPPPTIEQVRRELGWTLESDRQRLMPAAGGR